MHSDAISRRMRLFIMAAALRGAAALAKLPLERFSVAPMMDYSNQHFRSMVRLISANTLTYTEMVAADELLGEKTDHNVQQLLGQSATIPEGPSVLQLGGNDAQQLFNCAKIYDEFSQKI